MRPSLATRAGYRSNQSPLLAEQSFCRKSSMNMSIDNRYCNRFSHIGRPIFSVNGSGASVYNPDDIWERTCAVLHSRGTAHPICDPSWIIATRQLNALTVLWSHYISNNCIYIQSHLPHGYKLNCNRFNDRERPIFLQYGPPPLPWASGHPVAIQCAWNLDPSVHWNATGERIVGSQCVFSVLPVVFQWLSSGLPMCSNYAN